MFFKWDLNMKKLLCVMMIFTSASGLAAIQVEPQSKIEMKQKTLLNCKCNSCKCLDDCKC